MIERRFRLRGPLDLPRTLAPLRHGPRDPSVRLSAAESWLAFRTTHGPACLWLRQASPDDLRVAAWGSGAEAAVAAVPEMVGEEDRPEEFTAHHPLLRELARRFAGLRLPRSRRLTDALVASIIEQKVTGTEAFRSYAALVRTYGDPAPGPARLTLPPSADRLAALPYHAFHPLGMERRRADAIRHAAARAAWIEASADRAEAARRLRSLPGVGQWTVAEVLRAAHGDPDAVSVGDFHVPNMVAWALAGERRGTDVRMLDLLKPYRGQRGRVQRLLEAGRVYAPRRGPRLATRQIAAI